ncbi:MULTISPECIES: peptide deformylase [Paenibacillus]|uniref:Peptide deformylase n=2 Tax=Paenibacillus lactis TaxID=228574 RepID=G4HCY8_9BACL|nr:peptide deformylase [Paenibacillus lactis]EHB65914.1 peptide deformylase [Paenibacillus lactis 154]MBP1891297.1 peptide deformylase [Paenibacillus lactis]MCM3493748.1 peptide deformylase [Paenibacillus lactis]GIO93933.1 peptide deformylase [Paenibacillus lactis]HAF98330.1 peptide deformylase [Paenibacillus lactis]
MAVKPIVPFGDPILRKTARPVEAVNERTLKILDDLVETLYDEEGRAGLAAPQIGILRRLLVMDCGEGLIELINPEIVEMDGEQTGPEACLSYPGYYGYVKRADHVKVKTLNRQGETVILEGEGYLARCMQHEIDHLNGILFVDHVQDGWLYHEETNRRIELLPVIRLTNSGVV